jgi:hypothetical protein
MAEMPPAAEAFLRRYKHAETLKREVASILDDAYDYALPLRNRTTATGKTDRTAQMFDSTASVALQGFASTMLEAVWPSNARPFDLVAGMGVPEGQREEANRALAMVADDLIDTANNSDFLAAAHEMLLDWGIGTGIMMVEEGDAADPVRHTCVPLTEAVLGIGPRGQIDAMWRPLKPRLADVPHTWALGDVPDELRRRIADAGADECADIIEGVERDWSAEAEEAWRFMVVMQAPVQCVLTSTTWRGAGSCPVLWPSFMRVTGETIGRGPVQLALPDIKTLNAMAELVLANAELAMTGMWQYDDDGVFNPDTVRLEPGALIPRAMNSRGLEPVGSAGDFNVASFSMPDLRDAIRQALYWNDLGPLNQTPRTATEVMERSVARAQRLAGPAGRLLTEFLFPYVRRLAFIRARQGAFKVGRINGRAIKIIPRGPLTTAQNEEQVLRLHRFLQLGQQQFGPQQVSIKIDANKALDWQAVKMGIDPTLSRTQVEQQQVIASIAALAQQAQATGMIGEGG